MHERYTHYVRVEVTVTWRHNGYRTHRVSHRVRLHLAQSIIQIIKHSPKSNTLVQPRG